jgi:RNA polymerase sigma factor (sigma-70 family)
LFFPADLGNQTPTASFFEKDQMRRPSSADTRVTLLGRLRATPDDPVVWAEFVDWYGRNIHGWCKSWGMQESDAQDVTQEVFLNLSRKMHGFCYDAKGSFRAWLKTLTRRAWRIYTTKQRKAGRGSGDGTAMERLAMLQAREDLTQRLEEAFDKELLKEASNLVRLRVEPRTWEAFELLAIQGCSGAEVAERLKMKVATVFVARSKVQRMLREELSRLEKQ